MSESRIAARARRPRPSCERSSTSTAAGVDWPPEGSGGGSRRSVPARQRRRIGEPDSSPRADGISRPPALCSAPCAPDFVAARRASWTVPARRACRERTSADRRPGFAPRAPSVSIVPPVRAARVDRSSSPASSVPRSRHRPFRPRRREHFPGCRMPPRSPRVRCSSQHCVQPRRDWWYGRARPGFGLPALGREPCGRCRRGCGFGCHRAVLDGSCVFRTSGIPTRFRRGRFRRGGGDGRSILGTCRCGGGWRDTFVLTSTVLSVTVAVPERPSPRRDPPPRRRESAPPSFAPLAASRRAATPRRRGGRTPPAGRSAGAPVMLAGRQSGTGTALPVPALRGSVEQRRDHRGLGESPAPSGSNES